MAERRMFTKKITDDDNFTALSSSAQALYLHLMMAADDDGFCNQVSLAMFKAHASIQDLEALLSRRYLYQFDNGVIVIKHWRMANALRKDRYTPTAFTQELAKLDVKKNGAYTWKKVEDDMVANWLPDGCQLVAAGKDSIDKNSIEKDSEVKERIEIEDSKEEENRSIYPEYKVHREQNNDSCIPPQDINYEGLIKIYLKSGQNDLANHYYQMAKAAGVQIDVNRIKQEVAQC